MKQNDNLVKLAKITNTAASFLIFLAGLMLIFLPSTEVTSLQRTVGQVGISIGGFERQYP